MKSTILFDFDYTLADSTEGTRQSINYAFERLGLSCPDLLDIKSTIGLSLDDTYNRLSQNPISSSSLLFEKYFIEKADQVMAMNTVLFTNVNNTIMQLKQSGYTLGIVSTKFRYRIIEILRKHKISDAFSVIIGGEDVTQKKPHPEGIFKAICMLGVNEDNCIYVGDSLVDLETANRAGIDFLACTTGTTSDINFQACNVKMILSDIIEILPLMNKIGLNVIG